MAFFDEFLDDGGWAFDDLAGGDVRGDGRLRYLDAHGSSWSAEQGAAGKKLTTPLGWLGVSVETVGTIQWWEFTYRWRPRPPRWPCGRNSRPLVPDTKPVAPTTGRPATPLVDDDYFACAECVPTGDC